MNKILKLFCPICKKPTDHKRLTVILIACLNCKVVTQFPLFATRPFLHAENVFRKTWKPQWWLKNGKIVAVVERVRDG